MDFKKRSNMFSFVSFGCFSNFNEKHQLLGHLVRIEASDSLAFLHFFQVMLKLLI